MDAEFEQAFARLQKAVEASGLAAAQKVDYLRECLYGANGHKGDIVEINECLSRLPCTAHGETIASHTTTLFWHTWFWRGLVASAITGGGIAVAGKAGAQALYHIVSRL